MTTMDCEGCTDRLIDLLYGEIEDADAEATRAHLAGCEACAGAFERLESGHELAAFLTLETPPSVLDAVMVAARERAGRVSAKPEPVAQPVHAAPREARPDDDEDDGLWSSLMRWLGSFAMGPQAAMGSLLLLMVGIGLYYLPDWRSADPTDTHAIVDPAAGDEVGPSAGLEPAEPLALEEDPRRARIRPRDVEGAPAPAAQARARAPEARQREAPAQEVARTNANPPARDEARVASDTDDRALDEQALAVRATSETPRAPSPQPTPAEPARAPAAPAALAMAEATGPQPRAAGAATSSSRNFARPPGTGTAPPSSPSRGTLTLAQGASQPEATSDDMVPAGLHQMARNQAAANACPEAIRTYERLLARYPSYPRAADARVEVAACYRRVGQLTRARRSLEAARRDPRTSSRAQRELVRLEAAERAMDRRATETDRTPDRPAPAQTADEYEAPAAAPGD